MDDVLTMSRPAMRARRPELVPAILVAVLVGALFLLAGLSLRTPDRVGLTVVNDLDWTAEVSVRGAGSSSWTGVGAVARDGELQFLQLPDQGSDWVIRFAYGDHEEQIEVTRDQLAEGGWKVEVPPALGRDLEQAGVPTSTGSAAG